eukprot:TRINITY_DN1297_c0_g1_i1.p1 TRINITY_DN1297_c0_g1~~TRINITY_DN1297_c0_g1_i1.p1  ORF type:complete len:138 (+),score=26.49 TRINITY_DN1297_c0_g1_i1:27-416(+)
MEANPAPDFTQQCFSSIFNEFQFDKDCVIILISKIFGYAIVFGSSFVKLPQIRQMYKAKSGSGISEMSYILEIMVLTIAMMYSLKNNFPFSIWGDSVLVLVQDFVIFFLIFKYNDRLNMAFFTMRCFKD